MSSILQPNTVLFSTQITQRSIGPFTGYVCMEENSNDELEITQHPVQRGADITDHAYLKPATVSIRFIYTPNFTLTPLDQMYQELLALQSSREPFTIVTGKRVYQNMLFRSLSVSTDVTKENILYVMGDFQQVILVDVGETNVPVQSQQQIPQKTNSTSNLGDKKATPVDDSNVDLQYFSDVTG
ncbi:MAG: hypothetical protein IPP74_14350 [Alphaproteobacteria bacterium]|nr:hypothetical protein [Alphaproteobacteria bacterium]